SEATQQAMNKARSIAQALGGRILRVVEETEASTVSGGVTEGLYDSFKAESRAGLSTTPISTGQLSIKSNVQLIVEVES
ncbi:MAG: SIMPL domain-containing protein, partial [Pseudonocardiaceae bacterium]